MKQIFSFIMVAAFVAAFSFSDTHAQIDLGARIGVNISNYHFNTTPTNTTTSGETGILGGLQMDYWFSSMWAFNAQLLYVQKGAKFVSIATDQTPAITDEVSSNYLEIPLTAKLRFGDDGTVRLYATLGPTIGILLSANANATLSGGTAQSENIKDQFTSTDFGILGGVGLDILVTSGMTIFAEAAYRYGFANIDANSSATDTFNTENTRDIRISAGIVWTLSK